MKFWTFQRKHVSDTLSEGDVYTPKFEGDTNLTFDSYLAYLKLLGMYTDKTGIGYSGLIFGFIGSSEYPSVDNESDFYSMLRSAGDPIISGFSGTTHVLYCLDIPDDIELLPIEFYRFADLIYYLGDGTPEEIGLAFDLIFEPDNDDDTTQLLQGHIPYIKPEWIVSCVRPKYD